MKQLKRLLPLLLLAACAGTEVASAQINVFVEVDAQPPLKNQVSSYINRELRSLGNIVLVDEPENSRVHLLFMVDEVWLSNNMDRQSPGYLLTSAVRWRPVDASVREKEYGLYLAAEGWLIPKDELRQNIQELIAEWDTEYFDFFR